MMGLAMTGRRRMSLLPLFLISGAAVAYEIALTRYFAVAKWSEYGYWVISIVMVGFALSGVTIALARDWAVRHGAALLAWLPVALILAAAGGYQATTANPFNPLQLQNAVTFLPQLGYIALYYAVLLPFFFLTGLYISLTFVLNEDRVARVYGFDLTGAGAGAALVLGLMNLLHPFQLVAALLVVLAASALFGSRPVRVGLASLVALLASEAVLIAGQPGRVQRLQGNLRPAARARRAAGGRNALAARPLCPARRLYRAGRHRRVQQCRAAGRAGAAAVARPVSRRQPHRRAAESGRRRDRRLCPGGPRRAALHACCRAPASCWPAPAAASRCSRP